MRKSWGCFLSVAGVCLGGSAPPAYARELSLGRSLEISNQENFSYCALYSMASFLELYAKATKPHAPDVAMDPAYLATAFNHEVGNGVSGAYANDMMYVVQKYGAIPTASQYTEAVTDEKVMWPMDDWRKAHEKLMPLEFTTKALAAQYQHAEVKGHFTGKSFLEENIGVDFRDWTVGWSDYKEDCKSKTAEDRETDVYRGENYAEVSARVAKERERLGFKQETIREAPGLLTTLLTVHLYLKRPALMSLRTGLIQGFGTKKLLTTKDLVAEKEGRCGTHIGVAVGHCHHKSSPSALCEPFQKPMAEANVSECIVFQNSWGKHSNEKGYACLTRPALERALSSVVILRELL